MALLWDKYCFTMDNLVYYGINMVLLWIIWFYYGINMYLLSDRYGFTMDT